MAAGSADNIRVRDYLNDKFQTVTDLEELETLLSSVQTQQVQLREQLKAAETAVETARKNSRENAGTLLHKAQLFQQSQEDIERRRIAINSADIAKDGAARFSESMDKLRRLDVAYGYVELLQQVQSLSGEARKHVDDGSPKEALKPYTELQKIAKTLKARNERSESGAVNLMDYLDKSVGALWDEMKNKLSAQLQEVLTKVEWPNPEPDMKGLEQKFTVAFDKLLILQEPELESGPTDKPLLPFEVLLKPLALAFRYHFEGDRPTNRADKPEWFLAHITSLISSYSDFLMEYVQPILSVSGTPLTAQRNAVIEFITALLPALRRKIRHLLPQIISEPQLLSHFIHELINFDADLREQFFYLPAGTEGYWKGITHEVLVVEGGFSDWLKVEKEFALTRYHNILANPDAWTIDYDAVSPHETKPTKSALRLKDLLENITDTYRPLISFSQRLRFLIDIQIAILDQFHERLSSSVEAFRVLSSSIARAVQGTTKEETASLSGLGGLERLCRVFGSAVFMENCMRDWGEDIFFLELWEELQARAQRTPSSKVVAGNMNLQQVANVTSSAVGSGNDDGALFDETAGAYRRLRERTEEMIGETIVNKMKDELRGYLKVTLWSSVGVTEEYSLSPELVTVTAALQSYLGFLARALSPAAFRRIYRIVAAALQAYIYDYVVMRNQFSLTGGKQLERDLQEIWGVAGKYMEDPSVSMRKIKEVLVLLTLPIEKEATGEGSEEQERGGGLALRDIVKAVFEDNEKARDMLKRLGLAVLSTQEVRGVLQRRVEAWS